MPYAISFFENRPRNVTCTTYDLNKFHNAYFSTLLWIKDERLPSLILDYIDKHKEEIIENDEHEVLPWLAMLFNVKKNYRENEYDIDHLNRYIDLFKPIVSSQNYSKPYNTFFGELKDVMDDLKKCLVNLTFTRNPSDFVTDNQLMVNVVEIDKK